MVGAEVSRAVVAESQPWENGGGCDSVGANGGGKIMERSETADR